MTVSRIDLYSEVFCATAQEFVNQLRFTDTYWDDYRYGEVGFRGQKSGDWNLLPSAFRPGAIEGFLGSNPAFDTRTTEVVKQCLGELIVIGDFLALADSLGLPVPGDNQVTRSRETYMSRYPTQIQENWPPTEVLETLAIAQHHGVPTRLLDFTYHPLVAAFFAVADASETTVNVAVWAVNMRYVHKRSSFYGAPLGNKEYRNSPARVRVVTVPRAANSYLHAQHGFFLMDTKANEPGSTLTLEIAFASDVQNWLTMEDAHWPDIFGRVPPLTKFLLPSSEARTALKLLYKEGITHAHIYPSYDSVVETLRTHNKIFAGEE